MKMNNIDNNDDNSNNNDCNNNNYNDNNNNTICYNNNDNNNENIQLSFAWHSIRSKCEYDNMNVWLMTLVSRFLHQL